MSMLQYPTTLMLMSHCSVFLMQLKKLFEEDYSCLLINNVATVEQVLNESATNHSNKINFYDQEGEFNSEVVLQLLADYQRFLQVSTLIIDHDVPHVDGFALCQKYSKVPLNKILLVDEAVAEAGIEALNEKYIDYLIIKEHPGALNKLVKYVNKSSLQYVNRCSNLATLHDACLSYPYQKIKQAFLADFRINEFYQIDEYGSGIGISSDASIHWLVLCPAAQLQQYLEIAQHFDVTPATLDKLKSHSHLLLLPFEIEKKKSPIEWCDYLFKVQDQFKHGNETIYYSIVNHELFSLNKNAVVNYFQFKLMQQQVQVL